MKKVIFIFSAILALLLPLNTYADAADIKGEMTCKVKSQKIMSIEEGIPAEFAYITNMFEVGNVLKIQYWAPEEPQDKYSGFNFKIRDQLRSQDVFTARPSKFNNDLLIWTNGPLMTGAQGHGDKIFISPDEINLTSWVWGDVTIKRYYKNDWQALILDGGGGTQTGGLQTHIYTLDCRHIADNLDQFVTKMRSKAWNN